MRQESLQCLLRASCHQQTTVHPVLDPLGLETSILVSFHFGGQLLVTSKVLATRRSSATWLRASPLQPSLSHLYAAFRMYSLHAAVREVHVLSYQYGTRITANGW